MYYKEVGELIRKCIDVVYKVENGYNFFGIVYDKYYFFEGVELIDC